MSTSYAQSTALQQDLSIEASAIIKTIQNSDGHLFYNQFNFPLFFEAVFAGPLKLNWGILVDRRSTGCSPTPTFALYPRLVAGSPLSGSWAV